MRALRPVLSISTLCVMLGLAGGLLLGRVLSGGDGWQTPTPWLAYAVALLLAVGALSWLDVRRSSRRPQQEVEEDPWPLPPDYGAELDLVEPAAAAAEQPAGDMAVAAPASETAASAESASAPKRRRRRANPVPFPTGEGDPASASSGDVHDPASPARETGGGEGVVISASEPSAAEADASAPPPKRARRARSKNTESASAAPAGEGGAGGPIAEQEPA